PVITIDRSAEGGEVAAHIASDNVAGGKMAGELIIEQLAGRGKVVELEGISGSSAARERGQGFNDAIKEASGIEVVARQTANFDRAQGLSVMENIIQSTKDFQAVFAHNDEMALGALEAIEAAGLKDVIVVGFDATDDAVKAVEEGKLFATIAQKPKKMGEIGVETAVKVLNGERVDTFIPVELELIRKE
ncbi:MAG: substrate-binding domain-containing protein, partial [Bacillaceae bacterium]